MESSASSNTRLTCPSCRITVVMSRTRSMCPFCGNFYDPIAQINFNLRANRNSIDYVNDELNDDNSRDYNQLRFPRIVSVLYQKIIYLAKLIKKRFFLIKTLV